jgi:DNA-binding phage protein
MKKNKDTNEMTFEKMKAEGLCELSAETFDITYAKSLIGDRKRIAAFKKRITNDFNRTQNVAVFLNNLKILAIAKGEVAELADKTKMKRPNIYRFLSKDNNPRFDNLISIANGLGMRFKVA